MMKQEYHIPVFFGFLLSLVYLLIFCVIVFFLLVNKADALTEYTWAKPDVSTIRQYGGWTSNAFRSCQDSISCGTLFTTIPPDVTALGSRYGGFSFWMTRALNSDTSVLTSGSYTLTMKFTWQTYNNYNTAKASNFVPLIQVYNGSNAVTATCDLNPSYTISGPDNVGRMTLDYKCERIDITGQVVAWYFGVNSTLTNDPINYVVYNPYDFNLSYYDTSATNDDIINNQDKNTDKIIDNANKNKDDIINNQNQNQQQTNDRLDGINDSLNQNQQQTNDRLDSINDSLTSDDIPDSDMLPSLSFSFGPVSQLLQMPINFYNALNDLDGVCEDFKLGALYGTDLYLPCFDIWEDSTFNYTFTNPVTGGLTKLGTLVDYMISYFFIIALSQMILYYYDQVKNLNDIFAELYTNRK